MTISMRPIPSKKSTQNILPVWKCILKSISYICNRIAKLSIAQFNFVQLTNLKCKCQIFKLSFYCFTAFLLLAHNQNRKHTTMHKMQNAQKYTINKGRYETHLQLFKLASNQLQFGKCSTCVNFWQVSCNCTKNENIVFSQLDSFSQTENLCLDKVQTQQNERRRIQTYSE